MPGATVADDPVQLGGRHLLAERHRDRAGPRERQHRHRPFGPAGRDQGDRLADRDASLDQGFREAIDLVTELLACPDRWRLGVMGDDRLRLGVVRQPVDQAAQGA